MRLALVWMVALACGACGGTSRERAFCERLGQLCGDPSISAQDLAECSTEFSELKQAFGAEQYERLLTCGTEATSCMEIAGCMGGLAMNAGEQALDDLMRGMLKMRPGDSKPAPPEDLHRRPGKARAEDSPPGLPPECKRADEVCSAEEPFARAKCIDMIGDLKADSENRAKLVRCYEASKNCFAFKKCTTDLWFELQ